MDPTAQPNLEAYSASATLIPFADPLPLLRGPILSDPPDGDYVLAFTSPKAWATAYAACRATVVRQCESGAQIGCAISASSNCKPPWWSSLLGAKIDLEEREICEAREMEACVAAAKESCDDFAAEKCLEAFRVARIAAEEAAAARLTNYRASDLLGPDNDIERFLD